MPTPRSVTVLALALGLVAPAWAKDKVVRVTLGPFRIDAQRDREVCQAVRVPDVPGMEVTSYEVRSRASRGGKVGSHDLVIYGYRGDRSRAFTLRKNPKDVDDDPGCNGFGPPDFFRERVQLAGSAASSSTASGCSPPGRRRSASRRCCRTRAMRRTTRSS